MTDQTQFDDVPREALLAAFAELGEEPDWKAEYAKLYAQFQDRFHQKKLAALNEQLAEIGTVARLAIRVKSAAGGEVVRYQLEAVKGRAVCGATFPHSSFVESRIELLAQIQNAKPMNRHEAESPAV
jgi:hypothetical protein